MVKLILFFNLLIISSEMSSSFKRSTSTKVYSPHLIGGTPTDIRQHPFQASQRRKANDKHICGGSIISEKFVITAAHCIYLKDETQYYIFVGSTTIRGDGYKYDIESLVWHRDFSRYTLIYDIGLIGVKNRIVYGVAVKPVSILLNEIPPGTTLTVTGWGYIKYSPEKKLLPNNLQKIVLQVISIRECKKRYSSNVVITDRNICTFVEDRKVGTCNGDSGGPLSYHGYLVSLVSWGTRLCAVGVPDVQTKVAPYKTWINDSINQYCRKWPCPKNSFPNYVKW